MKMSQKQASCMTPFNDLQHNLIIPAPIFIRPHFNNLPVGAAQGQVSSAPHTRNDNCIKHQGPSQLCRNDRQDCKSPWFLYISGLCATVAGIFIWFKDSVFTDPHSVSGSMMPAMVMSLGGGSLRSSISAASLRPIM